MFKILILVLLLVLLFLLRQALVPLAIGIVMAYILDPYVAFLQEKLVKKRLLAVLAAYLTILIGLCLLVWGFADILKGKLETSSLQHTTDMLFSYYMEYEDWLKQFFGFSLEEKRLIDFAQSLSSNLLQLLVGMVASIYLLKDKDFFLCLVNKVLYLLLDQKPHGIVRELFFSMNQVVSAFLRGLFVDSVVVAFLSSLALAAIGVDFAVFIGCFAGITNIIPYFGPLLGVVPAVVAALSEGGMSKAILAALVLLAVQQIECNIVYPRIIGKSTGLHPLFVLLSVSVAGYFGGLLWMILAVPIAGILKVLLCFWAEKQ